jgi:hypothetical protein
MITVANKIEILDIIALCHDAPKNGLVRGQVGTVVERLSNDVFEVEFSDDQRPRPGRRPDSA